MFFSSGAASLRRLAVFLVWNIEIDLIDRIDRIDSIDTIDTIDIIGIYRWDNEKLTGL